MKKIRPLRADEIECRVGQVGTTKDNRVWCTLLLYKDARCDMKLMDETFGILGWKRTQELIDGNLFCTVSVKDPETGEWISRQDVGVEAQTEKEKSRSSDAFKRACVNFGIGRELYTAPKIYMWLFPEEVTEKNGKKTVMSKCEFHVSKIGYDDDRNITQLTIVDNIGRERYKMGQEQQVAQTSMSDIDTMLNTALSALKNARSKEECQGIWNSYPQLQDERRFSDMVTNRCLELGV